MSAFAGNMGFSTTDWVALFIFGVSALVGTFAKRIKASKKKPAKKKIPPANAAAQ